MLNFSLHTLRNRKGLISKYNLYVRKVPHRVHPGDNKAEDNMLPIKERRLCRANEELRPICVWTRVCHG